MLQQILENMFVDPEILSELDEEQKQILFVKMRAEQVRRWKEREEAFDQKVKNESERPKQGSKKVNFLKGADGCEWVWVMGEHKNDLSIEEILEQEAQKKAQIQAEEEALAMREKEELALKQKIEAEKLRLQEENERLKREMKQKEELSKSSEQTKEEVAKIAQLRHQFEQQEQRRLKELDEEQKRLRRRSMEIIESVKKRRSGEIYVKWREQREELQKQVEEGSKEVEATWKLQEEKSKEADKEMRKIAQIARIEYKDSLQRSCHIIQAAKAIRDSVATDRPPIPPKKHLSNNAAAVITNKSKPRPLRPRSRNMVIEWFIREERDKGSGLDPDTGKIAQWFHGIISRLEAEKLLSDKGCGAFLVRVSERVWGYTISYQENSRCKHFLIDATDLGYQFFGASQLIHKSLAALVSFHKETPITISGQEQLLHPCGQISDPPDYHELFPGDKSESTPL